MLDENRIQSVVFDADGVLIRPWGFRDRLEAVHGLSPVATRDFFRGPFGDCLVGHADLRVVLPPFLQKWNYEASVDDFLKFWFEADASIDEEVLNLVRSLRKNQYRCYLATNQERHRAAYMTNEMGLGALFDDLFFSHEIGSAKPEAPYFEAVQRKLGSKPEDILFIDDYDGNVEAARAAGWNAEVYTNFDDLIRIAMTYGLPL